jgi:hypothetical protein
VGEEPDKAVNRTGSSYQKLAAQSKIT